MVTCDVYMVDSMLPYHIQVVTVELIDTCFICMIDAVLEKCKRQPYRLDVIISNQKYVGSSQTGTTPWDAHFVKPDDNPVF